MSQSAHGIAMEWHDAQPSHTISYLAPTITEWLRESGARRVLDLGCGNGALTIQLANQRFEMVGVDASESGVRIAASRKNDNAVFRQAWLDTPLPSDLHGLFDVVLAVEVIEHLPKPHVLCARAREALKPSGRVIITTPYHGYFKNLALALTNQFDRHWQPLQDGGHIKFFSRASLSQLLQEQGFCRSRIVCRGRIPLLAKSMIAEAHLH